MVVLEVEYKMVSSNKRKGASIQQIQSRPDRKESREDDKIQGLHPRYCGSEDGQVENRDCLLMVR